MNARTGIVLVLGFALLGLVLLSWFGVAPGAADPARVTRNDAVVLAAESGSSPSVARDESDAFEDRRQSAKHGDGVRFRIFDAADLGPLVDATVAWRIGARDLRTEVADRDGVAWLPIGDEVTLTVACAGYCTLHGQWQVTQAEVSVPLTRGGAVEFSVVDAAGKPAADVDVVLLPPLVAGHWAADWHRLQAGERPFVAKHTVLALDLIDDLLQPSAEELVLESRLLAARFLAHAPMRRATDEAGVARWSGVLPGDGYRCAVLGRRHATVEPRHESQRLRVTSSGVAVGRPPPRNMSGCVSVSAMATTAASARLVGAAAVHGKIVRRHGTPVRVKLCRVSQAGGGDVQPVTTVDPVGYRQVDRDGRFRFENVEPGIFAVRACWLENDHDIYFVSTTLRLSMGMDLDLGELAPMNGAAVRVRAELRQNGQATSPAAVFVAPLQATANLSLSFVPDSQSLADAVTEVAVVPFGHDYLLHGVPPGRLQLQAMPRPEQVTLPHVQRLEAAKVFECRVDEQHEVIPVVLEVHGGRTVHVAVVDERGEGVPVSVVHAVDLRTGYVQSLAIEASTASGSGTVTLPRGRHLLTASLSVGGRWLAGVGDCDVVGREATARIVMASAATVRGRVAAPREGGLDALRWSPVAFAKQGVWLYAATPDENGEFVLEGVPAGIELHGQGRLPTLSPMVGGEVRNVGVISLR